LPERIPAFAKRKFLGRSNVDPRRFIVLGDSEAAIAAIDALRMGFTGEIINIPCSDTGKYENTDIFKRKFRPLSNNEVFYMDDDFLDRANISVIAGKIQKIDKDEKYIKIVEHPKPIHYDKILVAWGSNKRKLG